MFDRIEAFFFRYHLKILPNLRVLVLVKVHHLSQPTLFIFFVISLLVSLITETLHDLLLFFRREGVRKGILVKDVVTVVTLLGGSVVKIEKSLIAIGSSVVNHLLISVALISRE